MLINRRNALMAGKRLPYDAEVEYLESTGTQWINTGIVADEMFGFEITCAFLADGCVYGTVNGTGGIGTARVDWVRYQFGRRYNVSGSNTLFYGFNNIDVSSWIKIALDCAAVHTYRVSDSEFFVDGEREVYGTSGSFTANPFYLFASYTATGYNLAAKSRLYAAKLYSNGVLVRDLIPVRKGTVGYMYDRVSGQLFGNDGTGDFVLGPDVVPVEYIESHGTEWIDTGVIPGNTHGTKAVFSYDVSQSEVSSVVVGCRNSSARWWINKSLNSTSGMTFGWGDYVTTNIATGVGVQTVMLNYENDRMMRWPEGDYSHAIASNIGSIGYSAYLFAANSSGSPAVQAQCRIYSCQISDNSTLVRSFRPVRVGTEGAMMDVLTRRIYRNAGTGAFGYGNDLKYPIPAE